MAHPDADRSSSPRLLSPWGWLRASFFAGMVVAAPITVTVLLVTTLVRLVDRAVEPLIPPRLLPHEGLLLAIPGAGVVIAVAALTLLGAFSANMIGRSLIGSVNRVVARVPVVRGTYRLVEQVVGIVSASNRKAFREVVLVEAPRRGVWSIGFLTSPPPAEIAARLGPDHVGVFIPKGPVSALGYLLWTPRSEIRVLDAAVEEGAKVIMSGGTILPDAAGPTAAAPPRPR